jgi:glycosyltransferase involved in cell wall biosynthesis
MSEIGDGRRICRLVVAIEQRFTRVGDEVHSSICSYDRFWTRYLDVFDEVHVLARVADSAEPAAGELRASGPGVKWIPVPFYLGPWQYLRRRQDVLRTVRCAVDVGGAYMLRVPGTIGTLLWRELRRRKLPYGVEVVGDPNEVFSPGASQSRLRPLMRVLFTRDLSAQCRHAAVAAYVTRDALQRRYPCAGWTTSYSSVELDDEDFVSEEGLCKRVRRYEQPEEGREWVCAHIGSMAQIYKRQDVLLRAVRDCRAAGSPLKLKLVGSGVLEPHFYRLAEDLGVASEVEFMGQLRAGPPIRHVLDEADFFVLPSMTEGLPRVLIEAMARGLPCLATNVGGVPELLDQAEILQVRELDHTSERIRQLLGDAERMKRLAQQNRERARQYHKEVLQRRRIECYSRLAETAAGQKGQLA